MTDHAHKQKNVLATIENSMSKWKMYASISIFTTAIIGVWILFLVPVILFSTRPVDNVSLCQGNQQKRLSYFVDFFLGIAKLRLSIQRKLCLSIHCHKSNKCQWFRCFQAWSTAAELFTTFFTEQERWTAATSVLSHLQPVEGVLTGASSSVYSYYYSFAYLSHHGNNCCHL